MTKVVLLCSLVASILVSHGGQLDTPWHPRLVYLTFTGTISERRRELCGWEALEPSDKSVHIGCPVCGTELTLAFDRRWLASDPPPPSEFVCAHCGRWYQAEELP